MYSDFDSELDRYERYEREAEMDDIRRDAEDYYDDDDDDEVDSDSDECPYCISGCSRCLMVEY